jgi:HK97 family phage major capsid protein
MLKQLLERKGQLAAKIRAHREKDVDGYTWTAEDEAEWKRLNDEYDALNARIERLQRAESIETGGSAAEPPPVREQVGREGRSIDESRPSGDPTCTPAHRALALRAWCRSQYDIELTESERQACALAGINPRARELELDLRRENYAGIRRELAPYWTEQRAGLVVGTDAAGGYTVPEGFINNLEISLLQFGGVRQVADVIRTATGNDLPWPTVNDTGNTGELLAEQASIGSTVDPVFGRVVFNAFKYSSKLVQVSAELLQDSAFDLPSYLGAALGERIGRITNTHFTTGDGSSKPNGIVTASGLGVTAASATAIAPDELFDLIHSVDPAYRSMPGVGWMMKDSTLAAIRKLKDSQNRYLWEPSLQVGVPDQLLRYRVTVNQQMDAIATGKKTVLFGAMMKYKIRDVAGVRLRRLVERYADVDQEGFVAFLRTDGDLLDAGTDPIKHLIQA